MGKVCWDFPLLGTGNQSGSSIAAITMSKGSGVMDGLAREVCQNSLDAKDKDLPDNIPVKVLFELSYLKKSDFQLFDGYKEALENSIEYWKNSPLCTSKIMDILNNAKASLDEDNIPMLRMSDYNTIGLKGVDAKDDEISFWNLLVNIEGISIKQDDNSAGSFGFGKYAPFAYSALNLVLYNTFAKDGGRAFEGVARLVTTRRESKGKMRLTQPIGKYLYLIDEFDGRAISPNDECPIACIDAFNRTELGTDVAVVGFRLNDYPEWEKLTAVAIIKNFILAIMNGKLEIIIKSPDCSYEINKDTLNDMLFDSFKEEPQLKYSRQIYETIQQGKITTVSIVEKNDLNIYVKYDDAYAESFSRFRSTGMLINTTTKVLPHFSVVVVVNDVEESKLSKTLRESEPPQHDEWKASNIKNNTTLKNRATRYLTKLNSEVQKVLDEYERAEITDKMDAGIGNYLPDSSDIGANNEGSDGLRIDVKISDISSFDGRVFYNSQYETASTNAGERLPKSGIKTGKKKHKKKVKVKIHVVEPKSGTDKGVASGAGKVKIVSPIITDHRISYLAANKYKCYIKAPKDYKRVYLQFFAGREDDRQDVLEIRNVKVENGCFYDVHKEKLGPIALKEGDNILLIEFENHEIMAITTVFTMEVSNEK